MSTQYLTEITNDLFDVASRLKSINPNYRVYHNYDTDRFEVHDASRPHGSTLCFVVPYSELDARTISYALFTRTQNAQKIFNEVDDHNRKVERDLAYNATQNLLRHVEEGKYAVT